MGAMDFELNDELLGLQAVVRRLAQDKIKPRAREIDLSGEYPQDIFEEFAAADLLGLCIPEEYGGSGAGILGLTLAIEEVTKYSNVLGLMLLLTRLAPKLAPRRGAPPGSKSPDQRGGELEVASHGALARASSRRVGSTRRPRESMRARGWLSATSPLTTPSRL